MSKTSVNSKQSAIGNEQIGIRNSHEVVASGEHIHSLQVARNKKKALERV
jgi:hypothetical protein